MEGALWVNKSENIRDIKKNITEEVQFQK